MWNAFSQARRVYPVYIYTCTHSFVTEIKRSLPFLLQLLGLFFSRATNNKPRIVLISLTRCAATSSSSSLCVRAHVEFRHERIHVKVTCRVWLCYNRFHRVRHWGEKEEEKEEAKTKKKKIFRTRKIIIQRCCCWCSSWYYYFYFVCGSDHCVRTAAQHLNHAWPLPLFFSCDSSLIHYNAYTYI